MVHQIGYAEGEAKLDWLDLVAALEAGHARPKAEIKDSFLYRGSDTVLSRAAWIDGMGIAVKTATIFPGNVGQGKPAVGGGVSLFSDLDGSLEAIVDFHLLTKWKTVGDSLLAALKLAPEGAERVLVVGAGTVARGVLEAFAVGFPKAAFSVWARRSDVATALAAEFQADVEEDLANACTRADVIVTCTMATEPVIQGAWLNPGTHVNLIGAYRPDMREVDDATLSRAKIYVDSRETTLDHIGELKIPLDAGLLQRTDVLADYYTLSDFEQGRPDDISVFKNGGGAHLDLMTARYILETVTG